MNAADLHDLSVGAPVSAETLDKAAQAGVDAIASVLATEMGWTSGDFLPCQTSALEWSARVIAGAMSRMAVQNGLLPETPTTETAQ